MGDSKRGCDAMKILFKNLHNMSDATRLTLQWGIALGTLLHLAAFVALCVAMPVSVSTYHFWQFASAARETGMAVYFVTIVGTALLEDRAGRAGER